jgi:adenylosuccinate synthase
MRQVVLISGHICTGKTDLANRLENEFGYHVVRTSELILAQAKKRQLKTDRLSLQELGDKLDEETGHKWLLDAVTEAAKALPAEQPIVVDNVRTWDQLECFRQQHDFAVNHTHLYVLDPMILEKRFNDRVAKRGSKNSETYTDADLIKNEKDIVKFKLDADVRINTNRTDGKDTLVRVAARLGLYAPSTTRCVDVVIGGGYGSEGKGHVAAYLAKSYDVLVRVGGPNAGHTVSSPSGVYTYHQLPSGAKDTTAKLLLGPGMTIKVDNLLEEIAECGVGPHRLFIDPQAMIIENADIEMEKVLKEKIASTGSGSGAAAARRINGRKPGAVRLAKDIDELKPYVGDQEPYRGSIVANLEQAYRDNCSILLEAPRAAD